MPRSVRRYRFENSRLPLIANRTQPLRGGSVARNGLIVSQTILLSSRMSESRETRAKELQKAIGDILMQYWDPIGVSDIPEAQGEYDSYVGPVYRVLAGSRSEEEIISHLSHVEANMMGFGGADHDRLRRVAGRLLALDVRL